MKNVVILSRNNFPNGDAGAVRDFAFAKIYQELGFKVFCICLGDSKSGNYENVSYVSIRIERKGFISRLQAEFGYKARMKTVLANIEKEHGKIDLFHVVDIPINAIQFLKKYASQHQSKLVHDSVEWYSASNFKQGKLSAGYILKNLLNLYVIDRQFQVIAISKFLEKHFSNRGIATVRIPVIMDVANIIPKIDCQNDILQIVYAGSPGQKDYLREVIIGLGMLPESSLQRIKLNIIGVNEEQLLSITGLPQEELQKLGNSLKIYGRIPRQQVMELLKDMDFSILLRPAEERYAMAGFPTKLVESMSNAIPMICNLTSDLGDYLVDMENAVIVKDCTSEALAEAIKRTIDCSITKVIAMKRSARETAERCFDFRKYKSTVEQILEINN